jgi:hypothetical protein
MHNVHADAVGRRVNPRLVRGCSNLKSHCNYTPIVGDVVAYAKLVVLSQVRDRLRGPQWDRLFYTPHIDVRDGISGKEEPRAWTRGQRGREVCVPRGLCGCEDTGKEIRFWLVPWSDATWFRHLWHRCRFFEKTKKKAHRGKVRFVRIRLGELHRRNRYSTFTQHQPRQ